MPSNGNRLNKGASGGRSKSQGKKPVKVPKALTLVPEINKISDDIIGKRHQINCNLAQPKKGVRTGQEMVEARVRNLVEMKRSGWNRGEMMDAMISKWGISDRMGDNYMAKAYRKIEEQNKGDHGLVIKDVNIARLEFAIEQSMRDANYGLMQKLIHEQSMIMGHHKQEISITDQRSQLADKYDPAELIKARDEIEKARVLTIEAEAVEVDAMGREIDNGSEKGSAEKGSAEKGSSEKGSAESDSKAVDNADDLADQEKQNIA